MTYTVVDGMARCTVPQTATPTGASCPANANYTYGACVYSVVGAAHGGIVSAPDKTAGYSGLVSLTCNNGSWTQNPPVTCNPDPCSATTTTANVCTYSVPATASGTSVGGVLTAPGSYTGGITGSCNLGSWSFGGATCTPPPPANCGATTMTVGACVYPMPGAINATSQTASNSTPGYAGSIVGTCSDGTWTQSGATCTLIPPPPPPPPVVVIPPPAPPPPPPVVVIPPPPPPPPVVFAPCSATMLTSGGCTYPLPGIGHGASATASNTAPNYTGSITGTCTNGTWSAGAATCAFIPPPPPPPPPVFAPCGATTPVWNGCSYPLAAIAHGASTTSINTAAGFLGGLNASCNNATWTLSGATCIPIPKNNCAQAKVFDSTGTCSYWLSATLHGGSNTASNIVPNYTGSITGTCNNGSWSKSGEICNLDGGGCASPDNRFGETGACLVSQTCSGSDLYVEHAGGHTHVIANSSLCTGSPPPPPPPPAMANCAATTRTYSACTYSMPAIAHGASVTPVTSTTGYTGNITGTCTNGSWTFNSPTCDPMAPPVASCPRATRYWTNTSSNVVAWFQGSECSGVAPKGTAGEVIQLKSENSIITATGSINLYCSASGKWEPTTPDVPATYISWDYTIPPIAGGGGTCTDGFVS